MGVIYSACPSVTGWVHSTASAGSIRVVGRVRTSYLRLWGGTPRTLGCVRRRAVVNPAPGHTLCLCLA